jgi:RNase H-like domain found in reverse transcriptase
MLKMDILDYVIRIYISQPDSEGRLRLVAFYFRKMIPIELNYKIHNKELLVIIKAFRE